MNSKMRMMVAAMCLGLCSLGVAQTAEDSKPAERKSSTSSEIRDRFYRLDYTLRELDGSKEISKKNYSITVRTDNSFRELRTGTRVPVVTGANSQFQYIDVGVNVDSRAHEDAGGLWLEVTSDMSSIAPDEGQKLVAPLVRSTRGSMTVPVSLGKSVVVFSAEEPTSSRKFELSVTATQLR